jgi:hypothetical protein
MNAIPQTTRTRVALLIDGDNLSASLVPRLIEQALSEGDPVIRRVYGNGRPNWVEVAGVRFVEAGAGKNGADLCLAIDAMDIFHTDSADLFVLASSDGDFSHLAHRLREGGAEVIGIGEDKAPEKFRAACGKFIVLPEAGRRSPAPANPKAPRPSAAFRKTAALDKTVRAVLVGTSGNMTLPAFCDLMTRQKTPIRAHGYQTWRSYFRTRTDLYLVEGKGPETNIRLR